ncbi:MAG: hypothetical protein J0L51_15100 [Rhizobiales bacterium]|nr:hypothetical protein [Hyphomicrobiales bacterium]
MNVLPYLALSIRQPWTYAVAVGWKDIENRNWRKPNPGIGFRGRVALHASAGMTRLEYEHARAFMHACGRQCPEPHELVRGAIIGTAEIVDVVKHSTSRWFVGRIGLVMANAQLLAEPIPCSGALGFFQWKHGGSIAKPAKWMLPSKGESSSPQLF